MFDTAPSGEKTAGSNSSTEAQIVGNPNKNAVDVVFGEIVDRVMRLMRKSNGTFCRQYNRNEGFRENFRDVVRQIIENRECRELPMRQGVYR